MNAPPREFLLACRGRMLSRLVPALGVLALLATGHALLALALFCAVSLIIGYLVLSPYTRLLGPVSTESNEVLLTIDDGPHPDTTLALLDLLDAHQTKAVFFVIGERVQRWPELAKEIVRRGHEIGNHSMTHPSGLFWALGPWGTWRQIADCQQTIREVVGVEAKWFRAPVGHFNLFTHPALKLLGLELMSWSVRGFDGVDSNIDRVVGRIAKGLRPRSIVLLHEARVEAISMVERVLSLLPTITPSAGSARARR